MSWVKNVAVDLVVTALILVMVVLDTRWAAVAVWIYTPLMVVLKIVALFAGSLMALSKGRRQPPPWFFHLLYAVNVVALLLGAEWILAGGWVLIWALSALSEARQHQPQ